MSLIAFLVTVLVIAVIVYAVSLVLGMLPIAQPIKTIVWLIVAVAIVAYILNLFLGVHSVPLIS